MQASRLGRVQALCDDLADHVVMGCPPPLAQAHEACPVEGPEIGENGDLVLLPCRGQHAGGRLLSVQGEE